MKAAVLHATGEMPRYENFDEPIAAEGEAVVQVRAASLKPVDKQIASGTHYASARQFPTVCGIDGVGTLESGERVYFGGARPPHGGMAERTVVRKAFTFPIPSGLSDEWAAALPNPGVSAWLSLGYRGKLQPGEDVLILGATGVTGQLAIQIAKLLGARHVVAAGRNTAVLGKLASLGADATVSIDVPDDELRERFAEALRDDGFQVILDYVWGRPAQILLESLGNRGFKEIKSETRFVQVGEGAGPEISLKASVLRSAAVSIMGTAGVPPREFLVGALQNVLQHGAEGRLRMETERMPLSDVENAWKRDTPGRRIVLIP